MSLNDINGLSPTKWNCKHHIVFAPKYRKKKRSVLKTVSGLQNHYMKNMQN